MKGKHTLVDLSNEGHRERAEREDYDWLRNNGESHENALERLGWDEKRYKKLLLHEHRKENPGTRK